MEIVNPTTQWYTWILAAPVLLFWVVWVFLLIRHVLDLPLQLYFVRPAMALSFIVFSASAFALSLLQYHAFKSGPLGQLPQDQFLSYLARYAEIHYWRAWIVGIVVSLIFAALFWLIKRRTEETLLNQEEIELSVLFGFLNPWPQTAVFFIGVFVLFVSASLILTIAHRIMRDPEIPRLTITPFLFLAAFIAPIITRPLLLEWLHLNVIFITTS